MTHLAHSWLRPHRNEVSILRDTCAPLFIVTLFTVIKLCGQPRCPLTGKWVKENMAHIQTRVSFSSHEGQNHIICRKMVGTEDHYIKQNKLSTERQVSHVYVFSLTCGTQKKKKRMTRKEQGDTQRRGKVLGMEHWTE